MPRCFYCGSDKISVESDHYPIPKRHGGIYCVTACYECHHLKDRLPFERWPENLKHQALLLRYTGEQMIDARICRIVVAQSLMHVLDYSKSESLLQSLRGLGAAMVQRGDAHIIDHRPKRCGYCKGDLSEDRRNKMIAYCSIECAESKNIERFINS